MPSGARLVIVLAGVVVLGCPTPSNAQSTTVSRGLFRGSLPLDATSGLLQGAQTGDATRGLLRGSVPSGGTSGLLVGGVAPPGGTFGMFRGSLPPDAQSGLLRGDLPAGATVGALPAPAPAGARLGDPGPADVAGGLQSQARIHLMKGDYGNAESLLRRSVSIREQASGMDSPEVVQTLESNAALLRQWNREAAASEMETQVQEIRARQEPEVSPTAAQPPGPVSPAPSTR